MIVQELLNSTEIPFQGIVGIRDMEFWVL